MQKYRKIEKLQNLQQKFSMLSRRIFHDTQKCKFLQIKISRNKSLEK